MDFMSGVITARSDKSEGGDCDEVK